jgi:hypothetical protein
MSITAQVFIPYFACEYPPGSYYLRITDSTGATPYDIPISISGECFFIRGGSSATASLAKRVVDAINAYRILVGNTTFNTNYGAWTYVTDSASNATGLASSLRSSGGSSWKLTAVAAANDFDWAWLGLPTNVVSTTPFGESYKRVATTFNPAGTWFPKVRANDYGMLPSPAQVSYSAMTADGSVSVVNMSGDPALLPKWWTLYLDGSIGVHGGRMQRYRTAKPAWAAAVGVATDAPYVPLDYPGGWWSYAVRGTRFAVVDESVNDDAVYPLRIHSGPECPENMDPIRGLRSPAVVPTKMTGGRRDVKLAFLYEG